MSRCKSNTGRGLARIALFTLAIAASGCIQRGAPIETPRGNPPPPRAVQPYPGQPIYPAYPNTPVYQAPQARTPAPFPTIGSDLPPPNPAPIVSNIGTPRPVEAAPRPIPRPRSANTPYQPLDFGGFQEPEADPEPEEIAAPTRPKQPLASDDYATLVGDDLKNTENPGENTESKGKNTENPGPSANAGPAGPKVLVALLVPESDQRGSVRALADGLAKAASLAANDFNEPRLVLRKYDTGGDPRKAADAAKKAVADGAKLIIGPLFSGSASAVRPVAQSAGINVIAFTTDESVLGGGLYSIGFLPQTEINRIVSYAATNSRRNIALLVPDTPYGGVIAKESQAAASRSSAQIVKIQPFNPDFRAMDITATDFAKYYKGSPNVDGLLMATNGRTLGALSAYLAYRDVLPSKIKYLGLGLWDDKETFREATLRGGWFPGVDPALKRDFAYRYGQAYGGDAPSISFLGYDAVAVAAALLKNGGSDPFRQSSLLASSGFTGMSGLFRFRRDGGNDRALSILEVGRTEFTVVDPAPSDFSNQVSSLVGG